MLAKVARTGANVVFQAVGPAWLSPHEVGVRIAQSRGLKATADPSSFLQAYIDQGGRPFPKSLRMSRAATGSALNQLVHSLNDALLLP